MQSFWLANGNGYGIYDLYDLGEFDQKGSVATKFGTKDDLLSLSRKAKELGIDLLSDAVLNHNAGADNKERCKVIPSRFYRPFLSVPSLKAFCRVFCTLSRAYRHTARPFRGVR